MIDPFTAFAALKGATEAISSAIKTGRDLSTMSSSVAKWAKAEAGLQVITSEKPGVVSKLFGKLTGAEQNAIDAQNSPDSFRYLYSLAVNNPNNYSLPRMIRAGLSFEF